MYIAAGVEKIFHLEGSLASLAHLPTLVFPAADFGRLSPLLFERAAEDWLALKLLEIKLR